MYACISEGKRNNILEVSWHNQDSLSIAKKKNYISIKHLPSHVHGQ